MAPLRVAFISSEVTPFAKTGGLADVSASLPKALGESGVDVRVIMPFYAAVDRSAHSIQIVDTVRNVPMMLGRHRFVYSLFQTALPGSEVPVYLIQCPPLFDRDSLYTNDADEALRFLMFQRAAIEVCQRLGFAPDIFHVNDWQGGFIPLLLKTVYEWDELFHRSRSVFTIHNLGYQGWFGSSVVEEAGLGDLARYLSQDDWGAGRVSLLKTGLMHAERLTTVSPTYAEEIQTEALGMGMHQVLRHRQESLHGILNGVDLDVWSPRTDSHLGFRYSAKSLWRKEKNKEELLTELDLPYEKNVPVFGIVTRLTYQKGIDLLTEVLPNFIAEHDVRLLALGSGESKYEKFFVELQRANPGRVCFYRGYNEELSHRIEGSSDFFLMPSIYEPCGLNQMYSLIYGTIPIVRKTGGLADTVQLFDPETGEGNGVVFDHPTPEGVHWAMNFALRIHRDKTSWKRIVDNAMTTEDFSWDSKATQYRQLYESLTTTTAAEV